ncbi:MAG: hypothetical protein ACE5H7_12145 [Acidiferrobacterales bacterium]
MHTSIPTNIEQPPVFGWDLIAWSSAEWAFLAAGIVTAIAVIGIAYYVERYGKEAERESVEREVRDWVNAIIGQLDAKGRRT